MEDILEALMVFCAGQQEHSHATEEEEEGLECLTFYAKIHIRYSFSAVILCSLDILRLKYQSMLHVNLYIPCYFIACEYMRSFVLI